MTARTSSDDEALILASIDRFLERDVAPHAHELEATDTYPQAIVEQMLVAPAAPDHALTPGCPSQSGRLGRLTG